MSDGRDIMADTCSAIAEYVPRLERLVAEPPPPNGSPVRPGPPASIPLPGSPQAFYAITSVHASVRHVEQLLKYAVTGRPGTARGGSEGNTYAALDAIPKLAAGVDDDAFSMAVTELDRRLGEIHSVPGIDEARRYRHLPKRPGEALPPQCAFCGCYALLADVDAGIVLCSVPGCADTDGNPPVATMGIDETGQPVLTWANGLTERAPVMKG